MPSISEEEAQAAGALSDAWMEHRAQELDLVIEAADDVTLQLDIDSGEAAERCKKGLVLLKSLDAALPEDAKILDLGKTPVTRTSKNGNVHVTIKLRRPLDPVERIALQACLGSDPDRELLSLFGAWNGKQQPIVLFRPKESEEITSGYSIRFD